MDIAHSNNLRTVSAGILCSDSDNIIVRETNDEINLIIEPEKNSETTLYFMPTDFQKKYSIEVNFNHEQAALRIFGLYQLRDKQSTQIKTTMNHFVSHCTSKQLWKGVMHDASTAVFEGKIVVYPHAQKTDAQLSNKNLLLSKFSQVNTKPILEIYADDVKCSHGATVGCLDDNALFYLRSRGINEKCAREILVKAFINEVVETSIYRVSE